MYRTPLNLVILPLMRFIPLGSSIGHCPVWKKIASKALSNCTTLESWQITFVMASDSSVWLLCASWFLYWRISFSFCYINYFYLNKKLIGLILYSLGDLWCGANPGCEFRLFFSFKKIREKGERGQNKFIQRKWRIRVVISYYGKSRKFSIKYKYDDFSINLTSIPGSGAQAHKHFLFRQRTHAKLGVCL